MKRLNKIFLSGFITLLPIALTIYIIYSAIIIFENLLGSLLRALLPPHWYIPGFGLLLTVLLIFVFGLLLNNFLTARVLEKIQQKLTQVPFIKVIYSPLRDLMNLFGKDGQKSLKSVVFVKFGNMSAMGVITRDHFHDLALSQELTNDRVAVYFPWSYGVGGVTMLVSRKDITEVDMPIEKAMSLAITGWVKVDHDISTLVQMEPDKK